MCNPTPSRKYVICDHYGAQIQKKNLKDHTVKQHGKDVSVKERQPVGQQTLDFSKRRTEEHQTLKIPVVLLLSALSVL